MVVAVSKGGMLYKPLGWGLGLASGLLAGLVFKQVWKAVTGDAEAPEATDEDRGWGEVLAAAAVQGLIFALVRAAVERAGAQGVAKVTGHWPD
jgi:hypothetical protein